jgi:hypothetical protein
VRGRDAPFISLPEGVTVPRSDDFIRGYGRADLDFLQHENELATFAWPNPFDPNREPDAYEGYEAGVYDFTQK